MTHPKDNRLRRAVLTLVASAMALVELAGPVEALPQEVPLVLWVWERPTAAVLETVIADGFDTVYLHVPPGSASDRDIRQFVDSAHEVSVAVYALAGVPRWAQQPAPFYRWLDEVVASDRFDGVVIDVEPHLLKDWRYPKQRAGLLDDYLGVLEVAQSKVGGLPLVATVPFWWDEPRYRIRRDLLLVEEVLLRTDLVAIMAYRDGLASEDGIVALAADEVELAAGWGKQVVVSLQVAPDTLDKLTFFEEGRTVLEETTASLAEVWKVGRGLAGLAVHAYRPYVGLKP